MIAIGLRGKPVGAVAEVGGRHSTRLLLEVASSPVRRFVGLLGRRGLPPGAGLLLRPCASVHTAGMRFPIDVVYLDRDGTVVKVVRCLEAWRFSRGGRGARMTIELAAGEATRLGITPGMSIQVPA